MAFLRPKRDAGPPPPGSLRAFAAAAWRLVAKNAPLLGAAVALYIVDRIVMPGTGLVLLIVGAGAYIAWHLRTKGWPEE